VVEAVNRADEEYGEERLLSVLQSAGGATPDQLLSRIMVNLDLFVGEARQHDDITCMVVKIS
jgi:sigma-B regulation protein RsbU (phosphoserine phosphatase)